MASAALAAKVDTADVGEPGGVAPLDEEGKVPVEMLPPVESVVPDPAELEAGTQIIVRGGEYVARKLPGGWWDAGWAYRKQLTIDHTQLGSSLSEFPLFVPLADDKDIGQQARPDKRDLRFITSDFEELPYQLEPAETAISEDMTWCWFNGPLTLWHDDVLYAGGVTSEGDIVIASYDPATGDTAEFTLDADFEVDDHDAPGLLVLDDGRLMAFWSKHSVAPIYYRTTTSPGDITAWDEPREMTNNLTAGGMTYPKPFLVGDRIYLFFRGSTGTHAFVYSDDEGDTWSTAERLFSYPSGTGRPYVLVAQHGDRLDFIATEDHPRETSTSLYHWYFDDGSFYESDGTLICALADLPDSTGLQVADVTQIYDEETDGPAWGWDIAYDDGAPVVAFATLDDTADHNYYRAAWTGSAWDVNLITAAGGSIDEPGGEDEPHYSGGIALLKSDPSVVYLSREVESQHEVERWATSDGGDTWTSRPLTAASDVKQTRPMCPGGTVPDGAPVVLWQSGRYTSYLDYDTRIVMDPRPITGGRARCNAHVKVPYVRSAEPTKVWVYFGNDDAAASATGDPYDASFRYLFDLADANAARTQIPDKTGTRGSPAAKNSNPTIEVRGRRGRAQHLVGGAGNAISVGVVQHQGWAAWTFEAWIRLTANDSTNDNIVGNLEATSSSMLIRVKAGKLSAFARVEADTQVGGEFTEGGLNDGDWHHIAITFDTTKLHAYLDGVLSATDYDTGAAMDATINSFTYLGVPFRGQIDEASLSNVVRSAEWIAARAAGGPGGSLVSVGALSGG